MMLIRHLIVNVLLILQALLYLVRDLIVDFSYMVHSIPEMIICRIERLIRCLR
jgi:hypothetical protein